MIPIGRICGQCPDPPVFGDQDSASIYVLQSQNRRRDESSPNTCLPTHLVATTESLVALYAAEVAKGSPTSKAAVNAALEDPTACPQKVFASLWVTGNSAIRSSRFRADHFFATAASSADCGTSATSVPCGRKTAILLLAFKSSAARAHFTEPR